ncbi:MAG: type II toxin-antitoxin system Phd/YefM family antitoxin [Elusimicrobia bacterium]|nr:type II toxin-antitoxin system Phd/YefM family antitoxin [Elusimicrobiota bacterium]
MKTITATSARNDLFNVIKYSIKTHQPCHITSRAGEVILLSKDDFEDLVETLELLSTPGVLGGVRKAKKEIKEGKTYSLAEVFGH